jgi:diguanylate cyclase (GGDEF)-like protein/PAS domain S-box-containing protein
MKHQPTACERNDLCLLRNLADAIVITDLQGKIEYVNLAFVTMTGYGAEEVIGRTPRLLKSGRHDPPFYRQLWKNLQEGKPFLEVFVNRRKDGTLYYEEKTISPLPDPAGRITNYISVGKDITHRIEHNERLAKMAYYDPLTELANRSLLRERLGRAMMRAARRSNALLAVIFADLDAFKTINDRYGHAAGDQVLIATARRLSACVRTTDTVSRLAGDEFILLLEDLRQVDPVEQTLRKIVATFREPLKFNRHTAVVPVSLGAVFYPFDDGDADTLIRMADRAMYRVKRAGGAGHAFYDAELDGHVEALSLRDPPTAGTATARTPRAAESLF